MTIIEKIRAKIERKRQAIRVLNEYTTPDQMSKTCAIFQYSYSILSELLSFPDTLESEKEQPICGEQEEPEYYQHFDPDC